MVPASNLSRLPHIRALDGLRGVAVLAVLLFHAGIPWMVGGHLGVSVFFTLSGFLITSLLLAERCDTGRIALTAFWARRARRLVPAILITFAVIAISLPHVEQPPQGLIGDAVGSILWVANWRFVFEERTYADLFASPSPFQHFWSLAVEEQFYLLFPLLVIAIVGRTASRGRARLAVVLTVSAVASAVLGAMLHDSNSPIARAYYGTDTRAAELLVGALLATVLPVSSWRRSGRRWHRELLGAGALLAVLAAFATVGDHEPLLFTGGLAGLALCSGALIRAAVDESTIVSRALATPPLVALGKISYGAYLYHWPIFLAVDERSGLEGAALVVVRLAVTFALAAITYVAIEAPVRRGSLPAVVSGPAWANGAVAGLALVALASGQVVVPTSSDASADADSVAPVLPDGTTTTTTLATAPAPSAPAAAVTAPQQRSVRRIGSVSGAERARSAPPEAGGRHEGQALPPALHADPAKSDVPPVPEAPPGAVRIAVVGDSVGINLGRGLQRWASEREDVVVYNLAISACPISRGGDRRFGPSGDPFPISPACDWWDSATERHDALATFDPDVVVVQDGVNEMVDRRADGWDDYRQPGDPRFDRWLREEYAAAFARMKISPDAKVVTTNAVCGDWDRYEAFRALRDAERRVTALNSNVYLELPGATSADLFGRICPGGRYTDTVEGVENGRPDGIHLSDEAATALARNWLGPLILDAVDEPDDALLPAP